MIPVGWPQAVTTTLLAYGIYHRESYGISWRDTRLLWRRSPGAHGSEICWQQEVEPLTRRWGFGTSKLGNLSIQSTQTAKSVLWFGAKNRKRSLALMASAITSLAYGSTHLVKKSQTSMAILKGCCTWCCRRTTLQFVLLPRTRRFGSGKFSTGLRASRNSSRTTTALWIQSFAVWDESAWYVQMPIFMKVNAEGLIYYNY